jgi:hypothetical protein
MMSNSPGLNAHQTQPNFFSFYESGENMTQERFVKSREQAKRRKRVTTIESTDGIFTQGVDLETE